MILNQFCRFLITDFRIGHWIRFQMFVRKIFGILVFVVGNWKRVTVFPIHKGGDRSLVTNYRPVSLTSVVCKQMEHVIASYLRQVWDRMIGCTRVNMDSDRDIRAKVK